jgi:hypothetical protein
VLCRLVALALVTSENVLLHQCTYLGPPVMTQDKLKRFMFAGMPCSGRIMAGLDDLGTELLVVRDVQLSFVIQESVEFFPLEKVVNQSVRAFLAKDFESLSNFDFVIGAILNPLFECQGFGEGGGGKRGEAFRIQNQLVPIIFSVRDLEARETRERVSNTVFLARLVN